jgi:hypothetical protein
MHLISVFYDKWNGLIPILGGIYALLLAGKVVPIKFGDPEFSEKWHKRYGWLLRIIGFMGILGGMSSLLVAYYS